MKVYTMCLQKGGVGKTSLAVGLAGELAKEAGGVVIIDADPQGNSSGWLCRGGSVDIELADLLFDIAEGKTPDVKAAAVKTELPGLSIIPTKGLDGRLRLFAETLAAGKPNVIKNLVRGLAAAGFRYAIIDTSPAHGPLEKACLLATTQAITPTLGDIFSPDGLQIFGELLKQLRADYETHYPEYRRIVLNAYDKRIPKHESVLNDIKTAAPDAGIYCIPVDQVFRKAQEAQLTIQSLTGAKEQTLAELRRLAVDLIQEE
ncbi:chromosome partitioning protein ParA [Spirochaetia bacterium]|nr:chromosome partitioning protein ParA [Spirochaetia bacterium]